MAAGWLSYRDLDTIVVVLANVANLLVIAVFLARARQRPDLSHAAGIPLMILALPIALAAALNAAGARPWWMAWLLVPFVVHCAMELWLDYLRPGDFRRTWLLVPYLAVFYAGVIGLVGYGFAVSRGAGFVTLATYLLGLVATGYSYRVAGHGEAAAGR
ncbi:MAG: hypothetical protein ACYC5O_08015 [Anaerolineae bacterium]